MSTTISAEQAAEMQRRIDFLEVRQNEHEQKVKRNMMIMGGAILATALSASVASRRVRKLGSGGLQVSIPAGSTLVSMPADRS